MLIDAFYGELHAEEDAHPAAAHVAGCAACRQEVASIRGVLRTMDEWPLPAATGQSAFRALKRVQSLRRRE